MAPVKEWMLTEGKWMSEYSKGLRLTSEDQCLSKHVLSKGAMEAL